MERSHAQIVALVVTPMITGSISTAASVTLVAMIFKSRASIRSVYRRLLVGLSVADIILSLNQVFVAFMMPSDKETYPIGWLAMGNDITCDIQGFTLYIGINSSVLYSASISFYFLAMVNCQISETRIKEKWEKYMHGIPIVYGIGSGIAIWSFNGYNASEFTCSMIAEPYNCIHDENLECVNLKLIEYVSLISGSVLFLCFLFNVVVMAFIWWKNHTITRKSHRYATSWISQNFLSTNPTSSNLFGVTSQPSMSRASRAFEKRQKDIAKRAMAYILTFFLSFSFAMVNRLWKSYAGSVPFVVLLLRNIFFPLQGFFNIIIYTYPHALSYRRTHTGCSLLRAFWEVIKLGGDSYQNMHEKRMNARNFRRRRSSLRKEPAVVDIIAAINNNASSPLNEVGSIKIEESSAEFEEHSEITNVRSNDETDVLSNYVDSLESHAEYPSGRSTKQEEELSREFEEEISSIEAGTLEIPTKEDTKIHRISNEA